MKKYYEFEELKNKLASTDLANLFYVYDEPKLGSSYLTNNINRSVNFVGLRNHSKAQFATYTVKHGDTWTTIAYEYYGDVRLWWLVCKSNGIADPTQEPTQGENILLLRENLVLNLLEQIRLG